MNLKSSMVRALGFALLLLAAPLSVSAQPVNIPLKDFFEHAEFGDVAISPQGRYMAVTVPSDSGRNLAVIDISDLGNMQVTSAFELRGNESPINVFWVNNDRLIFETTMQVGALEVPARTGRVYAMNADGSNRRQLFGTNPGSFVFRQMSIISTLPEEPDWILIQHWAHDRTRPIAERLNVNDARQRGVASSPLDRGGLMADTEGRVRFAIGFDEDQNSRFAWRPNTDAEWRTFNNELGSRISPLGFSADGQSVYFSSRESEKVGVYRIELQSGRAEPLFENMRVELDDLLMSGFSPVKTDATGTRLLGFRFSDGKPQILSVHEDANEMVWLRQLEQMFDGNYVHIHNWTRDGKRALISVSSDVAPQEFFLLDTEAPSLVFIAGSRPWIDPEMMSPTQPISFEARDGLEIHGYMTLPQGQAENNKFMVWIHGGPHGPRDFWGFSPWVQMFASRGFGVLQINFRGSGGYGFDFEEAGYLKWGAEMQDDITDGTRWLIEQGYADADRICIGGASYGGFSTLSGITREPDMYACAFAFVGVYDLPLMKTTGDIPQSEMGRRYLDRVLGTDEDDLKARSPANFVENIRTPLFIAHGEEDIRAHVDHYHLLKRRLDAAEIPYEELLVADEGHGFYRPENNVKMMDRVLEFMLKHTAKDD
ncbi:alpha/beta hydrolase family protein [Aliidiomarina sanyensis]|uniref:Peptidase S9 prolyl oligopeptidase catalytic domain-containing protein n=1 Tax=Aliidiomarina sanyensis TaxID=1249555 RepID=A0A432WB68_9GAMM|nr:S9 family peptidase [Aliidiomarina sanyensis]RUO27960.1 hypothetical protein CWE11_11015 [Aliidiomarina sanyensis]